MNEKSYFFCPRVGCPNHRPEAGQSDEWYYRLATYETNAFGTVQRYRCLQCGKTFSDQTFSLNYYLKKKTDFRAFAKALNCRASDLFCARHWGYSSASIQTRVDRLARNAMFMHTRIVDQLELSEHVVADGLESYTASKYVPTSITILVGKSSEYLYAFTLSHTRRKGRMSEEQKRHAEQLYRSTSFEANELHTRFTQLLERLKELMSRRVIEEVELHTDEHPVYHRALTAASIEHLHHRRTNAQLPRNHANPLFAVNYFERLVRKDMVNHRRKSICFARDDRNMLSRFAWYMCAHNYFKPKRITSRARQTDQRHYSHIIDESAELQRWKPMIFDKRFLLSFSAVRGFDREVWLKQVASPLGERGRWNYLPKFALG